MRALPANATRPPVGRYIPVMMRAIVDLPLPLSPTRPKTSPGRDRERDVVDGGERAPAPPEHRAHDEEVHRHTVDFDERPPVVGEVAGPAAPAPFEPGASAGIGRRRRRGHRVVVLDVPDGGESRDRDVGARHRADEALRVGMRRPAEDHFGRAGLDEPAAVHDRDPVRHVGDDPHVVGDEDDAEPLLTAEIPDEIEDLGLNGDVEGGRRLVCDEELRVRRERERDHHPLAHSPRELVRVVPEPRPRLLDADLVEEAHGPRLGRRLGEA